ncbi:MAG: hypothetical protein IT257_08490 [Chitinophagaceae bacterium]|nr:hypothetical protein [Chitinophagaceae bacterium]
MRETKKDSCRDDLLKGSEIEYKSEVVTLNKYILQLLNQYSMKTFPFLYALIFLFQWRAIAQDGPPLRRVLELKVKPGAGTDGAGVVWHPGQRKYYAAMAGQANFPLTVYDEKGMQLTGDRLVTMTNLRGMWYNPNTKTIQTNGFATFGWREYDLDIDGIPEGIKIIQQGQHQPGLDHVGTYNPVADVLYFLDTEEGMRLAIYSMKTGNTRYNLTLHLQKVSELISEEEEDTDDEYNHTNALFTGIQNMEIALLNMTQKRIEFYNLNGLMTATRALPPETIPEGTLNFAYANGIFWLFNKAQRQWDGYK